MNAPQSKKVTKKYSTSEDSSSSEVEAPPTKKVLLYKQMIFINTLTL